MPWTVHAVFARETDDFAMLDPTSRSSSSASSLVSTRASWKLVAAALLAVVAAQQAWILAPAARRVVFPPQTDPAEQGREIAERLGCFACHGAEGSGGIPNPGSDNKVIPALSGGEMMMWADSEEELRHWILRGVRDDDEPETRQGLSAGQETGRALVMPAYESHLAAAELDLLVAYLKANSGLQFPEEGKVRAGFEIAHELGCFRCHGPMGTGGVANPGSLKGYVPGFFGEDYAELVQSREEAREWIRDGATRRFRDNPLAAAVISRQAVKMPAYGKWLTEAQIDSLVDTVDWLASGEWREMRAP